MPKCPKELAIDKTDAVHNKNSVFVMKISGNIPKPPSFKNGFDGKVFTVPKYYPFEHSETQWIINMFRTNNLDRIQRIAFVNPNYFSCSYFQIPDSPGPLFGQPMLHERVIMYLTPLALAVYLNLDSLVNDLISFRDQNGKQLVSIYQPCYITNVFINSSDNINDLMQIYIPCIIVLRQSFECVRPVLLKGKWSPLKPFSFLYRRPFKICKFSYKDIIDYVLSQLVLRTGIKLPKFIDFMITSLSEEFSLLYFEQIITQYYKHQIEEWVSIPRRLLRFAFYFDKDLRLISQIVRCIQVFQQNGFFVGPVKSCFEISYKQRTCALKTNFNRKICDPEEMRVILDQDNCFSLIFAMIQQASILQHAIIKDKLFSILPALSNDTMWLLHFLIKPAAELSHYFSHLVEKVNYIPEYVFIQSKAVILKSLKSKTINIISLKDLNLKPNQNIPEEEVLSQFCYMYGEELGYDSPSNSRNNGSNEVLQAFERGNNSNDFHIKQFEQVYSPVNNNVTFFNDHGDNSENDDELERFIKKNYSSDSSVKCRCSKSIGEDVIRLLEEEKYSS